ncbi:ThuA domain-containing protein [Mariniflexile sp. AS56]|uniref:ThuA domain-containing protein n=1 Tax=Mariniflexile sp. AS56 TaxID=3063957 RepID=UPI0026EE48F1|nr:ThuA domain-containing protein [Mariniflexile sp. AS56]MDO7172229.1 ThuA domain-containing protein [Mariniflexile sp. AS56]
MKNILIVCIIFLTFSCKATDASKGPDKVLVFTKTSGFRHQSIETGVKTVEALGTENNFEITHTEDASLFTVENLKQYKLVVFLNTTGDVLNESEEQAFESFIKNGGSFMGVHSATDTEYEWPWFGKLVGAYFLNHPKQATATLKRVNDSHLATKHLKKEWVHFDEWYNFKSINQDINVLLNLDESTYEGGKNGENHPIAWYHEFDGGRSFYTGLGHTNESYAEPEFKQHLLGGILYCLKR